MFSSINTFLLSPWPVALTSLRISKTKEGANSATLAICSSASPSKEVGLGRIRWPLPPPPPMHLRRIRFSG